MGTLKVTGGTLRSRHVPAPAGRTVRPTPARVREALFSIIAGRVGDAAVLDLFAGSGALGFEALSRGAAQVTFVESNPQTARSLQQTADTLGLTDRTCVIAAPVERSTASLTGRYGLVFADPPYALAFPAAVFAHLAQRGNIDLSSLLVYEHSSAAAAPDDPHFEVIRTARYGAVALAFLRVRA